MSALFTVTVTSLRGVQVALMFNAQDKAQRAHAKVTDALFPDLTLEDRGLDYGHQAGDKIEIEDDFGTTLAINVSDVMWVALVDVAQNFKGQEEYQIIQARASKDLNMRAASDVSLNGGSIVAPRGPIDISPRRN